MGKNLLSTLFTDIWVLLIQYLKVRPQTIGAKLAETFEDDRLIYDVMKLAIKREQKKALNSKDKSLVLSACVTLRNKEILFTKDRLNLLKLRDLWQKDIGQDSEVRSR